MLVNGEGAPPLFLIHMYVYVMHTLKFRLIRTELLLNACLLDDVDIMQI